MNHFMNNGKEYMKKEKKVRQYRSNQGRSPQQMESTYKTLEWTFVGFIVLVVVYAIGKAIQVW